MCHKKCIHLLVLHSPPLIFKISLGGGETGLLQTVVADAVCSVPGCYTVSVGAYGAVMVAAISGALQTSAEYALRIVPC